MPAIPLPFLVSGVLVVVALRLLNRPKQDRLFLIFVCACAIQTMLVGLRWNIGLNGVRFIQPLFAACLPILAYAAFVSLRGGAMSRWHLLWPAAVGVFWWELPAVMDLLLIVEFTAYGITILTLRLPDEVLTHVRIGNEWAISYARAGIAVLLLLSALSDTIVAISLSRGDGVVAAPVIAATLSVILLGVAGGLLGWATGASPGNTDLPLQADGEDVPPETEEEQAILMQVETALSEGLYRDYDLTLERLARRTRIPARKISRAVNRFRQCSVSDLVNCYRTREAMRLLRESDLPVTQIMLDSGFQTKSTSTGPSRRLQGKRQVLTAPQEIEDHPGDVGMQFRSRRGFALADKGLFFEQLRGSRLAGAHEGEMRRTGDFGISAGRGRQPGGLCPAFPAERQCGVFNPRDQRQDRNGKLNEAFRREGADPLHVQKNRR